MGLFAATLQAARAADLPAIDATIGAENEPALGYYQAMGFQDHRKKPGAISRKYTVN